LTIADPLPAPTVTGEIHFVAEFSLTISAGLSFWLDGVLWPKTNAVRVKTANHIECRDAQNNALFWLEAPRAWDSQNLITIGELEVRRDGGQTNLFITVRIPKSFFDAALFPVYIDPTIDVDVSANNDDGKTGPTYDYNSSGQNWAGNYYGAWSSWFRFTGISGLAGSTITTAQVSNVNATKTGSPACRIYAERANAPGYPTSTSDFYSRTRTTAYVTWGGTDAASPTPSVNSVIQELADDFDPSVIQIFMQDNGSSANENYYYYPPLDWGETTTLYIEYTEGGGGDERLPARVMRPITSPWPIRQLRI
jgi:hypothetical protein